MKWTQNRLLALRSLLWQCTEEGSEAQHQRAATAEIHSPGLFIKGSAARKALNKDAGVRAACRRSIEQRLLQLENGSIEPSYSSYASILRDCGSSRSISEGRRVHAHIAASSCYSGDRFLLNLLVQMYTHCGCISDAQQVFESIPEPNLFSWNIMFTGLATNGHLQQSWELFMRMPQKNVVSWNAMITALAQNHRLDQAKSVFDRMHQWDLISWNALISAYTQNGDLFEAMNLFEEMPEKNTITWSSIVSAHAQKGQCRQALRLFRAMDLEGFHPDRVTVAAAVSACSWLGDLSLGRSIHWGINEDLASESIVITGLINLYGKCGCVLEAERLFSKMPVENMVGWTSMITAYGHNGLVEKARKVFNSMTIQAAPSWNAMLSAYAQNGHQGEAFNLFCLMDLNGVTPNAITIVNALDVCLNSSSISEGKRVHEAITGTEFAGDDSVRTGLVNMYAKCGSLSLATELFNGMKARSLFTWNALLAGYTQAGLHLEAILLFHQMQLEAEAPPDSITFFSLLSACGHAGLVPEGFSWFSSLHRDFEIVPEVGLYGCIVDMLARLGWLKLSEKLIDSMPVKPDVVMWICLLGGCKMFGDFQLAIRAARKAHELDPGNSAPYSLLSNMYNDARSEEEATLAIRAMESVRPRRKSIFDFL